MTFSPGEFDDAVSIATAHHLTDDQLAAMVRSATAAAATLHVIDAILRISPVSLFKTALFRMDRGRHVRTFEQLRKLCRSARAGRIVRGDRRAIARCVLYSGVAELVG